MTSHPAKRARADPISHPCNFIVSIMQLVYKHIYVTCACSEQSESYLWGTNFSDFSDNAKYSAGSNGADDPRNACCNETVDHMGAAPGSISHG